MISFHISRTDPYGFPDGGWGLYAGDDSNVYMTVLVLFDKMNQD